MNRAIALLILVSAGCTAHAESKDKIYSIATTAGEVTAEAEAEFKLTITPKSPWVLKTTTPLKATLAGSGGVELERTKLNNKDLQEDAKPAMALKTHFKCKGKGEHTIKTNLSFFLCTEEICQRYTDTAKLTVTAK